MKAGQWQLSVVSYFNNLLAVLSVLVLKNPDPDIALPVPSPVNPGVRDVTSLAFAMRLFVGSCRKQGNFDLSPFPSPVRNLENRCRLS